MGKQNRSSFKLKKQVSISRPLEILHIDLCGPIKVKVEEARSMCLWLWMTTQGSLGQYFENTRWNLWNFLGYLCQTSSNKP